MARRQRKSRSWRNVAYHITNWTWIITTWIWSTIIIGFLVQFVPNILTLPNATSVLPNTWAAVVINWLRNAHTPEIPKEIALGAAILLVAIPPLAFLTKQLLQHTQKDGFDKIIDFFQKDIISPQLDALQDQLKQHDEHITQQTHLIKKQLQTQAATSEVLRHISELLEHPSTTSTSQAQDPASQQQQDAEQQEKFSIHLRNSSLLSELMLNLPILPDHQKNGSFFYRKPSPESIPAGLSPTQTDDLPYPLSTTGIRSLYNSVRYDNKPSTMHSKEGNHENL